MTTRRDFFSRSTQLALAAAVTPPGLLASVSRTPLAQTFTLPPLRYAQSALEPYIDATTMRLHHARHHQAYVDGLNAAVAHDPSLATRSLDAILGDLDTVPESVRVAVRNFGGGHWNHSLFWQLMSPGDVGAPSTHLDAALRGSFGDVESFRTAFDEAALARFGSGWIWLVRDGRRLAIMSTANQDNPIMRGARAADVLLGLDLWEHAYYLQYQNRRAEYVSAWWHVLDWDVVNQRFARSTG